VATLADRVFALTDAAGNSILLPRRTVEARELLVLVLADGGVCLVQRDELLRSHVASSEGLRSGTITRDEAEAIVSGIEPSADEESLVLRCPDGGYYVLPRDTVAAARLSDEDSDELEDLLGTEVSGFAATDSPGAIVAFGTSMISSQIEIRRLDSAQVGLGSRGFDYGKFVS
jgi:hypothetical protein